MNFCRILWGRRQGDHLAFTAILLPTCAPAYSHLLITVQDGFLWPLSSQASTPSAQLKLWVSGRRGRAAAEVKWKVECLRLFKERKYWQKMDTGVVCPCGYADKYIFFVIRNGMDYVWNGRRNRLINGKREAFAPNAKKRGGWVTLKGKGKDDGLLMWGLVWLRWECHLYCSGAHVWKGADSVSSRKPSEAYFLIKESWRVH